MTTWKYSDGGRLLAGFKGDTGDCVTRAIAIALEKPYREVYDSLNLMAKAMQSTSSARLGVHRKVYERYLKDHGWRWVPCMKVGQGCKVHLTKDELPGGRIIVRLSRHVAAVIDGMVYDNHDCTREGTRCVYGYFTK